MSKPSYKVIKANNYKPEANANKSDEIIKRGTCKDYDTVRNIKARNRFMFSIYIYIYYHRVVI